MKWKARIERAERLRYFNEKDGKLSRDFRTCFVGEKFPNITLNKCFLLRKYPKLESLGYQFGIAVATSQINKVKEVYEQIQNYEITGGQ